MKNINNPLENFTSEELNEIADRIIHLRQDVLHMTQQQFSGISGISQPYLSLLESQKKELNMDILMRIASSFNVNFEWLVSGSGGNGNIFRKDYDRQSQREDALASLKKAYSLNISDIEFIKNYLDLSDKERCAIAKASEALQKLF